MHEYADSLLGQHDSWPLIGSPAWCELPDDDPRKLAAAVDAAQHWALRLEQGQREMAETSRAIAAAVDWPEVSRQLQRRRGSYIQRAVRAGESLGG